MLEGYLMCVKKISSGSSLIFNGAV